MIPFHRFWCVFEVKGQEAWLKVTEQNQFKMLVHLSLKFRQATDEILKGYLAGKLTKEKTDNEDLRIKNSRLEEALSEQQQKNEELQQLLSKLEQERESETENLKFDAQKKIHLQKEEFLQRESELRKQLEQKQQVIIDKLEKHISEQGNQIIQLTQANSDLSENKLELESQVRELTTKNRVNDKEISVNSNELMNLRLDNKNLDSVRFAQEKKITELQVKLEGLERIILDKESLISSGKLFHQSAEEQKKLIERDLQEKNESLAKLDKKLDLCKAEIEKGNEVIDKLREVIDKKKKKLKLKSSVILQLEQHVQSLQHTAESLNKQVNESKLSSNVIKYFILSVFLVTKERDQGEVRQKDLINTNNDLKQKLSESEKILEQNQSIIQYLNGQLNSHKPPQIPSSISSATYKPTYSAAALGGNNSLSMNKYSSFSNNNLSSNLPQEDKYELPSRQITPLSYSQKVSNASNYSYGNYQFAAKSPLQKSVDYSTENKYLQSQQQESTTIGKYIPPSAVASTIGKQGGLNNLSYSNQQANEIGIVPVKYRDPTKS